MIPDYAGKVVLVTGGTMGLGLETGLAFGRAGAIAVLTHRWGTADEGEVRARFAAEGSPEPLIVEADVGSREDTAALMETLRGFTDHVEAFVSNVSLAHAVRELDDYSERGLQQSVRYSAWPLVGYTLALREAFGRYPRYVVGMSSTGPDHFSVGYDFVAASKSVMETLCRYLSYRLREDDVRVNAVRSRSVRTASFDATFGTELSAFADRFVPRSHWIEAHEVADAVLALCSGMLDAVRGQVITVDRGTTFVDNLMRVYTQRDELPL